MTVQDVFNEAISRYNNAKVTIAELSKLARQKNPNFSYEVAMKEFDSVLQAILLKLAIADGKLTPVECQFVEKITDYIDIIQVFNAAVKTNYTWQGLLKLDRRELAEFSDALVTINKNVAEDFVTTFAKIDRDTSHDYFEELIDHISMILSCLSAIDGEQTESELTESISALKTLIADRWNQIKNG